MNILLINNGTIRLAELKSLLQNHKVEVIEFCTLDTINTEKFNLIILSGSTTYPILGNESLYKQEIDLIKNSKKPIIGICLGFELIGYVYGAELEIMQNKEKGIVDIQTTDTNDIFKNLPNFSVYESHRW